MIYEYRLTFTAPVHFGIEGIGQERIEDRGRSDTLWGAIIQQWLLLYPQDVPEQLCLQAPFLVSSCFPLINDIPFYPLPLGALDYLFAEITATNDQRLTFKDLRGIRFVCKDLFTSIIQGGKVALDDIRPDTAFPLPPASLATECGQPDAYYSLSQRPRLRIDQLSGGPVDGAFYYCADQYFNSAGKSGLFFLASFVSEGAQQRFEAALRLLADTGLGGDRSVGRGSFVASEAIPSDLPCGSSTDSHLLLSLYHPTKDEVGRGILKAPDTAFYLVRRVGHAAAPQVSQYRRSDLWMIEEGAVVRAKPEGDVVCVIEPSATIPHAVYRCGRAFSIPVKLNGQPTGAKP